MHDDVLGWFSSVRAAFPFRWHGPVVELGSYDINGSIRALFEGCEYTGVDVRSGPGVDLVCSAHDVPLCSGGYAIVASAEMLEHDENWRKSIRRMLELVSPGGLVIITCAAPGREPHGLEFSPYYRNVGVSDALGEIGSAIRNLGIEVDHVEVGLSRYRSADLHIVVALSEP